MRAIAVMTLACAGCSVSPEPYEVVTAAELSPGTANIAGALEVLGTGEAIPSQFPYHIFAAFHVRLPDDTPRRIRLYTPASCDTPHTDARALWNFGQIRRVGDETHFFSTGVEIGDRLVTVDVVTRTSFVFLEPTGLPEYYIFNLVAVVEDLVPGEDDVAGPMSAHSPVMPQYDWLACGGFTPLK
jgi:hypothetical protein